MLVLHLMYGMESWWQIPLHSAEHSLLAFWTYFNGFLPELSCLSQAQQATIRREFNPHPTDIFNMHGLVI